MTEISDNPMLVSLDIGTSKVVAMVAEVPAQGALHIAGVSCQSSRGLKRGMIVDIESTVLSIKRAIEEAELMADCKIDGVTVGIGGNHITSMNSHGIVAIDSGEVTESDLDRVVDAAKAVAISADQKILHILPQEYVIDGQDGIRDPLGMSGVRLEVKVHIVIGSRNVAQNIEKCLARCDLQMDGLVVNQLASSHAVLTDDEKELGVCLIDMGGGTLDVAVYTGGAIRHTAVIPVAGDQVTNDIAMALRTPTVHAEDIKVRYACALAQLADMTETVKVPSVGERPARDLSRQALAEVVEPRYEELFSLVQAELRRSGFEDTLAAGVVLTGGTALMEGAVELAEEIFHMPVRLAKPKPLAGAMDLVNEPNFATSLGLLHYASEQQVGSNTKSTSRRKNGADSNLWLTAKEWVVRNF
ncbi:MAG: cell division protein FtsA [Gammaproteobacteria bacterium]|nr:cell division protein FtsA [Gammaproteobacteria bacterium]